MLNKRDVNDYIKAIILIAVFSSVLLALSKTSAAATIYGNVYDSELNRLDNAVIEINSEPAQKYVAKNGTYQFFVPPGNYMLEADYYGDMDIEENISVDKEGSYSLDLILMPNLSEAPDMEGDILAGSFEENAATAGKKSSDYTILAIVIILFIIAVSIVFYVFRMKRPSSKKKARKEKDEDTRKGAMKGAKAEETGGEVSDEYKDRIIELIRKNDGRATQKDIRRELPYSEAKISLVIAELEHKGIIEKIKKGRGNIIILKK